MVLNIRKYDLWGITNGIDIESWNPMSDPQVPYSFNTVSYTHLDVYKRQDRESWMVES